MLLDLEQDDLFQIEILYPLYAPVHIVEIQPLAPVIRLSNARTIINKSDAIRASMCESLKRYCSTICGTPVRPKSASRYPSVQSSPVVRQEYVP